MSTIGIVLGVILLAVVLGLLVGPIVVLITSPTSRRLALRNAVRRPREAILVIAGSMLATALMTASFVVGDTMRASIRANVHTQLGPIDELVAVPLPDAKKLETVDVTQNSLFDGALAMTTTGASAAVVTDDGKPTIAVPKIQLIETDFAAARDFGDDAASTGMSGANPESGEAVLVDQLAEKLGVDVGDTFNAYAFGNTVELRVGRVVAQRGVAGFWRGRETVSYNAFVAGGTIAALAATPKGFAEPPQALLAFSNRGGVEGGAALTEEAERALRRQLPEEVSVVTIKQDSLDAADAAGDGLTKLYSNVGGFAVLAGILLLINIFRMLADERKSELGMLRAMGMRRRSLIASFTTEGWLYAIVASVIGTVLGLGVGRLVMAGADKIINDSDPELRLPIRFDVAPASLVRGFTIGFIIAMVTIAGTSIAISRFNIIAAIRDIDRLRKSRRRGVTGALASVGVLGLALLAIGLASAAVVPMIAGGAMLAVGANRVAQTSFGHRVTLTVCAAATLVWGVVAVPVAVAFDGELPFEGFLVQGIVLVIAAVVLISEYQGELGAALSRLSGRRLSVRLGLAYPLARKQRTALTLGQFSIVVFILVYISVIASMFRGQIDGLTTKISGGFNTVVASNPANPVAPEALASAAGVRKVAPIITRPADITPDGKADTETWPLSGIDSAFVAGGAPALEDRGAFKTDRAAFEYLVSHPGTAIIDDFFLSLRPGPPSAALKIGDSMTVANPQTGATMRVKIIARGQNDWVFNGGLVGASTMQQLFGASAVPNRAYVLADNPAAFAASAESEFFAQGAEVDPLRDLVEKRLVRQTQFFTLIRAFLALGLVIGIAGIGVIMVRAVRERRRQVGMLRALGFPANSVSNAFAIEALFVALEGVVVGILLGWLCTWSITFSDSFGDGLTFRIPWFAMGVLVSSTLIGALLATFGPARSASKIKPAVALRIAD